MTNDFALSNPYLDFSDLEDGKRTHEQLRKRTVKAGYHHGKFNPLSSSWWYPAKMNMIQLIILYLMGCPAESILPLRLLRAELVVHFDTEGCNLSRMWRLMRVVKHYPEVRNCWKWKNATNYWNGEAVTRLGDGIWSDLGPYLLTETQLEQGRGKTYHKSRGGQLAWQTCHEKIRKQGVYKALNI